MLPFVSCGPERGWIQVINAIFYPNNLIRFETSYQDKLCDIIICLKKVPVVVRVINIASRIKYV